MLDHRFFVSYISGADILEEVLGGIQEVRSTDLSDWLEEEKGRSGKMCANFWLSVMVTEGNFGEVGSREEPRWRRCWWIWRVIRFWPRAPWTEWGSTKRDPWVGWGPQKLFVRYAALCIFLRISSLEQVQCNTLIQSPKHSRVFGSTEDSWISGNKIFLLLH